ncbi:MAG: amidohydrolase [Alphaproteobacteria bacterium]|nr:amidohydrolase [Alphaproteobacteria bacterium]
MKKIDIFPHIFPKTYFDKMVEVIPNKGAVRRWLNIPVLYDLDARLRMMEEFGPDYQQILTLSMPAIEYVAPPETSPDMARLGNDGMAEIVAKYPKRFPAFAASVPMNNVKAALAEIRRSVETLDARGIQIMTNVNGRPLDDPEFAPIFELMHSYDLPVWMHPTRPQKFADYPVEKESKFDIWWCFGWPYETSAAMARMVFSGFFDRWPNLKIITHHLGAMVPFLEARVGHGLDQLGTREGAEPGYDEIIAGMRAKGRRPVDYFKMFFADTSINGSMSGTKCGIDFFGCDHVLFGTDCPFDPEGGPLFIRDIIKVLDAIDVTEDERKKLYHLNAQRLLKLKS